MIQQHLQELINFAMNLLGAKKNLYSASSLFIRKDKKAGVIYMVFLTLFYMLTLSGCLQEAVVYPDFSNPLQAMEPVDVISDLMPVFTWNVQENTSLFTEYDLFLDDQKLVTTEETTFITETELDGYEHSWYVRGKTSLRYYSSVKTYFQLADSVAPSISLASLPEYISDTIWGSLDISGTVEDNNYVATVFFRCNEEAWIEIQVSSQEKQASFTYTYTFEPTAYSVLNLEVYCVDVAGNVSETLTHQITMDDQPPELSITTPSVDESDVDGSSFEIAGTIEDNVGIDNVWIQCSQEGYTGTASEWQEVSWSGSSFTHTQSTDEFGIGLITITVKVSDTGGNEVTESISVYNTYFTDDFEGSTLSDFWKETYLSATGSVRVSAGLLVIKKDEVSNIFSDQDSLIGVYLPVPERDFIATAKIKLVTVYNYTSLFGGFVNAEQTDSIRYVFISGTTQSKWGISYRTTQGTNADWDTGATNDTLSLDYYLRLSKSGTSYTFSYSKDGTSFTTNPGISNPFTPSENLNAIGFFLGSSMLGAQLLVESFSIQLQ